MVQHQMIKIVFSSRIVLLILLLVTTELQAQTKHFGSFSLLLKDHCYIWVSVTTGHRQCLVAHSCLQVAVTNLQTFSHIGTVCYLFESDSKDVDVFPPFCVLCMSRLQISCYCHSYCHMQIVPAMYPDQRRYPPFGLPLLTKCSLQFVKLVFYIMF